MIGHIATYVCIMSITSTTLKCERKGWRVSYKLWFLLQTIQRCCVQSVTMD